MYWFIAYTTLLTKQVPALPCLNTLRHHSQVTISPSLYPSLVLVDASETRVESCGSYLMMYYLQSFATLSDDRGSGGDCTFNTAVKVLSVLMVQSCVG